MTLAIVSAGLSAALVMIGSHAQRSVGGREFYIAATVCALVAVAAIAWRMKG